MKLLTSLIVIMAVSIAPACSASESVSLAQIGGQGNATKDFKIKGNKNSRIYHLIGCPNYNSMLDKNVVWFKTEDEARAAGYRKAKNCEMFK